MKNGIEKWTSQVDASHNGLHCKIHIVIENFSALISLHIAANVNATSDDRREWFYQEISTMDKRYSNMLADYWRTLKH